MYFDSELGGEKPLISRNTFRIYKRAKTRGTARRREMLSINLKLFRFSYASSNDCGRGKLFSAASHNVIDLFARTCSFKHENRFKNESPQTRFQLRISLILTNFMQKNSESHANETR